ncbi:MAG: right-handed parallel beta-helix repeat-containing protein [Planctomycetia bacterium]
MRILLTVILLTVASRLPAAVPPTPLSPAAGDVVHVPHPHFRWEREPDVAIDEVHCIQIAGDEAFAQLVCDDRLEVVSRYVPVQPLQPGRYWWRVRRGDGPWSGGVAFEFRTPASVHTIAAGSDAATVARAIREAAAHCPARVDFEPGDYSLAPPDGSEVVKLTKVHDLDIDGHGARLVLDGTLLVVNDSARVTIRNVLVLPNRPGHTLVRIVGKDAAARSVTVTPEPGHDPDVLRFFERDGNGGSFLGCMDPVHHGRYLVGAGISARTTGVAAAPNGASGFVFSPVEPATLERIPLGGVAVVTVYHRQWIQMNRTDECTFSNVTVTDLPGAFCGGSNNSAKSYLSCRVKPRSPQDFYGGHAACGSGRIGEWIEGCEFACLPDDGPAEQSFRVVVEAVDEPDTVVLGGHAVRAGDHVALVNAKTRRGVAAVAVAVEGARVRLDCALAGLSAAIGRDAKDGWSSVFLYRDAPSNEDFVYRRNRHVGGRAHGVKFNGTRGWIADNHFENINGNAVLAGYTSEVSGHGARDVVVSGNTIVRCGWTPISVWSTSGLGGNIIVRGNRIEEARDAAIAIRGCDGVTITDNAFVSSTAPKDGAWITADGATHLRIAGNRHAADVPELRGTDRSNRP